jgi:hypothetical protein
MDPAAQRVAVIGASADRSKFGNKSVRAHLRRGWTVYPVHPSAETIEELTCFRSVADIPEPLDRITVYVPPEVGITLLPDIAAAGADEVFFNPGSESDALLAEAERLGIKAIVACSIVAIGERP